MALTKTTVSGTIGLATGIASTATLQFTLTGWDTDGQVISSEPVSVPLDAQGGFIVDLWPNERGLRGTQYQVTLLTQVNGRQKTVSMGAISVPDQPGAAFEGLLGVTPLQLIATNVAAAQSAAEAKLYRDQAAAYAAGVSPRFDDYSQMIADTGLSVGDIVLVSRGFNGVQELFRIVAAGTYTSPDGVLVQDCTGISAQAVSARRTFANVAEMLADSRGYEVISAGETIMVPSAGYSYRVLSAVSSGHLTNGATTPLQIDVLPAPDGSVRPSMFGIDATGVTVVTDAFESMISMLGDGAVIKGDPGGIYLIDGELAPRPRQTFDGNGATIRRAPQAAATLQNAVAIGGSPTSLQLDDASGFRVGSYVTVTTGAGNTDPSVHRIISKTGNTIDVGSAFSVAFSAGAQVISAYHLFRNTADDVCWSGWAFDGNRGVWQTTGLRWENVVEIRSTGARCSVVGNFFREVPAEGIILGGAGSTVHRCSFENAGGNPIHLSGGDDLRITECHVENANLVPVGEIGHEDGCIAWSQECRRAHIAGNTLINGLSGFGEPTSVTSDRATIEGNTVIDCTMPFEMGTYDTPGAEVMMLGNRFYNCGEGVIAATKGGSVEAEAQIRIQIRDNLFSGTTLRLQRCWFVDVEDNHFFNADVDIPGSGTFVTLNGAMHSRVRGNVFDGIEQAVYADAAVDWLEIASNTFRRCVNYCVSTTAATGAHIAVSHNTVRGDSGQEAVSFFGVALGAGGQQAFGNLMDVQIGANCLIGGDGALISGNVLRSPVGIDSIRMYGGSSGAVIHHNYTQQAINNGGGVSNTVESNYLI